MPQYKCTNQTCLQQHVVHNIRTELKIMEHQGTRTGTMHLDIMRVRRSQASSSFPFPCFSVIFCDFRDFQRWPISVIFRDFQATEIPEALHELENTNAEKAHMSRSFGGYCGYKVIYSIITSTKNENVKCKC